MRKPAKKKIHGKKADMKKKAKAKEKQKHTYEVDDVFLFHGVLRCWFILIISVHLHLFIPGDLDGW